MEPTKLVRMANQIAANLDHGSDAAKSVAGVIDHVRRFWTPLMLDEMAQQMAGGETELSPIAERALKQLLEERRAAG